MKLKQEEILAQDKECFAATYGRMPIVLDHGNGATLWDVNDKAYIDFGSGVAVNTLGAADKGYLSAVETQLHKLTHSSNYYSTEAAVGLAQRLTARTGAKKVFLGNSGAEANECAIKVARKYSYDRYGKGRDRIVTLSNSFHGRTVTTLAATGQDVFHQYFFPFTEGFDYAPANDYEGTIAKIGEDVCAVMIELIQGEGGVIAMDRDYVKQVAAYCAERDVLLLLDEVQTGNGRTGTLYAYQQYGFTPDVMTTAKGLAGGLPIGACLMFEKTADVLTVGTHGSTFGGNPVCCAAANYILDVLNDDFLEGVRHKAALFNQKLQAMGCKTYGLGLMIGAEPQDPQADAHQIAEKCAEKGLLILTAKNKLRFLPPLNIKDEEIECGLNILAEVLKGDKQ